MPGDPVEVRHGTLGPPHPLGVLVQAVYGGLHARVLQGGV